LALLFLAFILAPAQSMFAQKDSETKIATATVLLREMKAPDSKIFLQNLKSNWKVNTDDVSVSEKTIIVNAPNGLTLIVAQLPYPAPVDEIGVAARLSWLWPNAWEETKQHQSQWVITVAGSASKSLDMYKLLTLATAAALESSSAAGVLMSSQYLLLPPGFFNAAARNMSQNQTIPLYCWVYFGRPGGGNGFTVGMEELGLAEMEIAGSEQNEAEVHATLYDAAMSVMKYGTKLGDGQSVVTEEGAKIQVLLRNGTFLQEKKVLKLDY
jgi:hypothetical protein